MSSLENRNIFRSTALLVITLGIIIYVFFHLFSPIDGWVKINRRKYPLKVAELKINVTNDYLFYEISLETKDPDLFRTTEGGQTSIGSREVKSLKDIEGRTLSYSGFAKTSGSQGYNMRLVVKEVRGKEVDLGFSGSYMAYLSPAKRRKNLTTATSFNGDVTIKKVKFINRK